MLFRIVLWGCLTAAFVQTAFAQTEQYGHKRTDFEVGNARAFMISPAKFPVDGGRPWVWYAPTIGGHPNANNQWVLKQLLEHGFTVVGINVGESYGSPAGRRAFTEFYVHLTQKHQLDAKANLLAQSRGGLMLYNWAVENPTKVRTIVGIYPVCDLCSYPGLGRAAGAYEMSAEELEQRLTEHNPIDRLAPLAQHKVPLLHIHGDSDAVVPLVANSQTLVDRYKALGGPVQLIVVPKKGHAEIAEFFQRQELVDFILQGKLSEN